MNTYITSGEQILLKYAGVDVFYDFISQKNKAIVCITCTMYYCYVEIVIFLLSCALYTASYSNMCIVDLNKRVLN